MIHSQPVLDSENVQRAAGRLLIVTRAYTQKYLIFGAFSVKKYLFIRARTSWHTFPHMTRCMFDVPSTRAHAALRLCQMLPWKSKRALFVYFIERCEFYDCFVVSGQASVSDVVCPPPLLLLYLLHKVLQIEWTYFCHFPTRFLYMYLQDLHEAPPKHVLLLTGTSIRLASCGPYSAKFRKKAETKANSKTIVLCPSGSNRTWGRGRKAWTTAVVKFEVEQKSRFLFKVAAIKCFQKIYKFSLSEIIKISWLSTSLMPSWVETHEIVLFLTEKKKAAIRLKTLCWLCPDKNQLVSFYLRGSCP